ncbi:MAG: tRNA preQ1(34) S-adenosylmethionine ribosyltransferase-isomerase QueA, partial [Anaerovoracaceae bacterium]
KDFNYNLPKELIAQKPIKKRDNSRLLIVDRKNNSLNDKHFYDILKYLNKGDCLVLNKSKVLPARIFGVKKDTGAKIEILLLKRQNADNWEALAKPGKKLKVGDLICFYNKGKAAILEAKVIRKKDDGVIEIEFSYHGIFMELLEEVGEMPLPPYIERPAKNEDKDRYQTVYCQDEGSVAAPTAGLHFTEELLKEIRELGVNIVYVNLHVGLGTFRPVKVENVEEHEMHFEEFEISKEAAETINNTKEKGGRVIAVGTTSARTLESCALIKEKYFVEAKRGSTGIFIYPGYEFKIVDSLITNFHLPKSTLMMLISAFYNREKILETYEYAIAEKYRFFSYGDAMLIL